MLKDRIHDELLSPENLRNPYPYYAMLREEAPVYWNQKFDTWVVTSYEAVVWALRHQEHFSSEVFLRDEKPPSPPISEEDFPKYKFNLEYMNNWFIRRDRPDHLRMRKTVHPVFNPKYIDNRFRTMVQNIIQDLLQDFDPESGEMDVLRDFANAMPVLVIANWLGMPAEDREFIRTLSRQLLSLDQESPDRHTRVHEAITTLNDYVNPLVETRVSEPSDDLLSVLAIGEREGELSREEVLGNTLLLLIAGHQTTINLVGNGTMALMRNPEQWNMLKEDDSLLVRATEELLRYDSPVKRAPRIALEDIELGGQKIREGEKVMVIINAANRDPMAFENPEDLDITRYPNPHVAFGGGIHHCLGANLARLEGQEAFRALTRKFPPLKFASDPNELEYHNLLNIRGVVSLPAEW